MPSSFCKIPVNFMIKKMFSLNDILFSPNFQVLILGKILWLILVWAAVWKANKIVLAVFLPHSNSQRWWLLWIFFVIQNLFKVAVTLALAEGEVLSGSKPANVEVSSINFVVLDYSYNFVVLDCSYDSFCAQNPLFTQHDIWQVSIGDSNLEVKGLGGKTLSRRLINPVNIKLMEIKSNLILDFSGDWTLWWQVSRVGQKGEYHNIFLFCGWADFKALLQEATNVLTEFIDESVTWVMVIFFIS